MNAPETSPPHLRLAGEWTIARAAELVAEIERLPWRQGLHLDVSQATRVDFTFLQILFQLKRHSSEIRLTDPEFLCRKAAERHGLLEAYDKQLSSP